jgi:hypothetical protein
MEESKANIIDNKLFFLGQMDLDSSPEYQKNGTYGRATNVNPVNYAGGFVGTLTNVTGNEEVSYTFAGLTANPFIKVVGSKLDEKRRRVYYLVYGQNSDSDQYAYIVYYSYDTQAITTVFSFNNILDLNPNFVIDSVNIVYDDELGDTLMWTDGNSEPKKVNVTAGVNRFNSYTSDITGFSLGDIVFADTSGSISGSLLFIPCVALASTNDFPSYSYTTGLLDTSDWETLSVGQCYPPFLVATMFYQKPITPYYSPLSKYNYDETLEEGAAIFLRRRSFQFRYKYTYFDGQESEWSPISEAVFSRELTSGIFTVGSSTAVPEFPDPTSVSIRIPIHAYRFDSDNAEDITSIPHAMIAKIKIAVREVPTVRTPTDWLQLDEIPFEDFYKHGISQGAISENFPTPNSPGTYYYNWDTLSFYQITGTNSRVISLTYDFDGSQTLTPIDVADTSAIFYKVPKKAKTQTIGDNKMWWGGITDGMNISKSVVDSINSNLTFTANPTTAEFINSDGVDTINIYTDTPTITNNNSNSVTLVWDLDTALNIADYNSSFQLNWEWYLNMNVGFNPAGTVYSIENLSDGFTDVNDLTNFIRETVLQSIFTDGSWAVNSVTVSTTQLTIVIGAASTISISSADFQNNSGLFKRSTYFPERSFKNHSIQQFAVAFQDVAGRISPAISLSAGRVEIPHFIDGDFNAVKYKVRAAGIADIVTPDDAVVMHLLRKRSESWFDFIHFSLSEGNTTVDNWNDDLPFEVGFINLELDSQIPTSGVTNKNVYISLNSVNGGAGAAYESYFDASILTFTPTSGDIVRFLYKEDGDGDIDQIYNASFNIDNYDERTNTIVLNFDDIEASEPLLASFLDGFGSGDVRIMAEVVKQPPFSKEDLFWEVSAQLTCNNGAVLIASNDFIDLYGDTYLKLRGYCVNYTSAFTKVFENFVLQDKNYNDFSPTNNVGEGRPNKTVKSLRRGQNIYVESQRDNEGRWSETSTQNTDFRRYGTSYDTNVLEVDNVFGSIKLFDAEGDTLNIYQEDKISRALLGRSITTELSGSERIIATENNVISDIVYNNFNGGISKESESFAKNGYQKYFTDSKRGKVYRQSMDGITPISEVGMSGYFKDIFRKVRNSFTTPIVRGIIDERTDEYILSITYSEAVDVEVVSANSGIFTFQKPDGAVNYISFGDGQLILIDPSALTTKYTPSQLEIAANETAAGVITVSQNPSDLLVPGDIIRASIPKNETLVFSERTKGWTTFLGYTAEWLEGGIQSYHTFFNGEMWFHDLGNTDYNTFFDTLYNSDVVVYGNKLPQLSKYWRNIAVKTKAEDIEIGEGGITTSEEQVSHLPATMFSNREGVQFAPFLGEGTGTEVNNSNKLKGRWIKTLITMPSDASDNKEFKLFGVAFISGESGLTY